MKIEITVHWGGGNAQHLKPPPPGLENDLAEFREWALKNAIVHFRNIDLVELLSDDGTVREYWRQTGHEWVQDA